MAIKRLYDTLVGATVRVNQLVDEDTSSVTLQSGHKYYAKISGAESIGASAGTAISVTGGTDMVTDLTAMLGSTIADYLYTIESATAGAGIAKLREWGFLTGGYIPHNVGTLESVEATAHKTVGFNQFNADGFYHLTGQSYLFSDVLIGNRNELNISFLDNDPTVDVSDVSVGFCVEPTNVNAGYAWVFRGTQPVKNNNKTNSGSVYPYGTTCGFVMLYVPSGLEDALARLVKRYNICINLSNPDRNGEYEPYSAHTYDLGTDTLRGLFKLDSENRLYADGDTKTSDGVITRKYGIRAYQSGDESLADSITDGTNTVYKLTTPTTEQSTPFTSPQICDPDGTEEYITGNGVPVGHETRYQL